MAVDEGTARTAPTAAFDDARCPRCGRTFHCGLHDARPCACTTLRLSAATLAELRTRYNGCLCLDCLGELARGDAATPESQTPQRATDHPVDRALDAAALIERLKERIANFKVPKRVFTVDALPRNAMGKVQKNLLRTEHAGLFAEAG